MKCADPSSHIDHLLRQTRMHHMQLSSMADFKANILLTLATVVMTLCLRYYNDPVLRWAALCLSVFCLITVILAAYSVMPKVPLSLKPGPHPDVFSPGFNLLFFGDFAKLTYPEYLEAFERLLTEPDQVYEAQIREVYLLGKFLAEKKYRFIRMAYISLMLGFLSAAAALATGLLLQ